MSSSCARSAEQPPRAGSRRPRRAPADVPNLLVAALVTTVAPSVAFAAARRPAPRALAVASSPPRDHVKPSPARGAPRVRTGASASSDATASSCPRRVRVPPRRARRRDHDGRVRAFVPNPTPRSRSWTTPTPARLRDRRALRRALADRRGRPGSGYLHEVPASCGRSSPWRLRHHGLPRRRALRRQIRRRLSSGEISGACADPRD